MANMPRLPVSAKPPQLPFGGTLILLMLPDHFSFVPSWVWPVCWTLWGIVWIACIVDVVRSRPISEADWRRVFDVNH